MSLGTLNHRVLQACVAHTDIDALGTHAHPQSWRMEMACCCLLCASYLHHLKKNKKSGWLLGKIFLEGDCVDEKPPGTPGTFTKLWFVLHCNPNQLPRQSPHMVWHHRFALWPLMKEAWRLWRWPQGRTCHQAGGADTCFRRHCHHCCCVQGLEWDGPRRAKRRVNVCQWCQQGAAAWFQLLEGNGWEGVSTVWGWGTGCWGLQLVCAHWGGREEKTSKHSNKHHCALCPLEKCWLVSEDKLCMRVPLPVFVHTLEDAKQDHSL